MCVALPTLDLGRTCCTCGVLFPDRHKDGDVPVYCSCRCRLKDPAWEAFYRLVSFRRRMPLQPCKQCGELFQQRKQPPVRSRAARG